MKVARLHIHFKVNFTSRRKVPKEKALKMVSADTLIRNELKQKNYRSKPYLLTFITFSDMFVLVWSKN